MLQRACLVAAAATFLCSSASQALQTGGAVQQVLTTFNDTTEQRMSTECGQGYGNIPGAFISLSIPPGGNQLVVARFSGRIVAGGGTAQNLGYAQLRIVAGNTELHPRDSTKMTNAANAVQPPVSIERSIVFAPGTHVVRVQACYGPDGDFTASAIVYSWQLSVEAAPLQP